MAIKMIDEQKAKLEVAAITEVDESLLRLIQLFKQRKNIAKQILFNNTISEDDIKKLEDQFEYCNNKIKLCLGL